MHALQNRKFEDACIHLFPAMDTTAKKRRPKNGVGDRIKKFLSDQEDIISVAATGNYIVNCTFNGLTFPEAIYKFGRTSIVHEGELDERLKFTSTNQIMIGEKWSLPSSYILAMCVAVMAAPENSREKIDAPCIINLFEKQWPVNEIWGAEKELREIVSSRFSQRRDLESI
jgi:hypothetical protein